MANTMTNLLWHTGRDLGAEVLARMGPPERTRHPAYERLPPAVLEHAVRRGDTMGTVGAYRNRHRTSAAPGDESILLRLLERDDPEVNEVLFRRSSWPALREAVLSQRRFAPVPDPELADIPLPLTDTLRESLLAHGNRTDLEAALAAADPDLVFWALVSGVPGGSHGGRLARLRACVTLSSAGRRAQLRHVLNNTAPVELPRDAPPGLQDELRGARTHSELPKVLDAAYGPESICVKLRQARQVSRGRAVVRDVLEPPWHALAAQHAADPLPWGAAVALLEHSRCPAGLQVALLASYPRAAQSIMRPGPEVLEICHRFGEDQLTKKVLLRGVGTGSIDAAQMVAEVRPARIALTALVHGGLEAVATQAAAIGLVRALVAARLAEKNPDVWRAVYAALPDFAGTAAELITAAEPPAPGPELPRLGRQSAWAYITLIGIAGPEHAPNALGFLDDTRLAPLAGARGVPQSVAEHVVAHGGPVARRVLAGNPEVRADLLEALVLGGDRAIASAAYRNPRCTLPLRQYILSVDGIDADLRAELLAEKRPHELWPVLASPDEALLRHVAGAAYGELALWTRLRAAYRLAELYGVGALEGLPDEQVAEVRRTGSPSSLRVFLRAHDKLWLKHLTEHQYFPRQHDIDGIHGAFADPGLDWSAVLSAVRRGKLTDPVLNRLAERPDFPLELARMWRDTTRTTSPGRLPVAADSVGHHRSLAVEVLERPDRPPVMWFRPEHVLNAGTLTVEEFVASGDAAHVLETATTRVPVARAVARLLHDGLGDAVDAWVVIARLLREQPPATLAELVATARAAT